MFHPSYLRFFSNIDGANVQISFLFWVLKAINDHLDTLDSTGKYIYTYHDIQKPKLAKIGSKKGYESELICEGE